MVRMEPRKLIGLRTALAVTKAQQGPQQNLQRIQTQENSLSWRVVFTHGTVDPNAGLSPRLGTEIISYSHCSNS